MREKECAYWVLRGISPEEGRKWREERREGMRGKVRLSLHGARSAVKAC